VIISFHMHVSHACQFLAWHRAVFQSMLESGTRQNCYQICATDEPAFGARFLELIYGAGFWHMCHGPWKLAFCLSVLWFPPFIRPWLLLMIHVAFNDMNRNQRHVFVLSGILVFCLSSVEKSAMLQNECLITF